ncbi:MAG: DsbA family protein [Emcibacter sp.]|nr:DsbA family protein [Emcibacter sp.]
MALSFNNAWAEEKSFLNYDMVMGDKNAPIEIIEYASTTCPHCAHFHENIMPELKKKFVDTGKVKIIFRNYVFQQPFDIFATSLNRCVSEDKFFPLLGLYFKRQPAWVKYKEFGELKPYGKYAMLGYAKGEVIKIAKIAGMSETEAYQCLARTDVLKFLMDTNADAQEKYQVNSTPTIIVNGKKLDGYELDVIEKAIMAESK